MKTHSTELSDAKRRLHDAYEECPHWDYDEDGTGHDCCDAVASAKERVRRARAARED